MGFDAKAWLPTVPEDPGVYRMIGADEDVLYVGKAKNLRRRVSSYFQRTPSSPRIGLMVAQVARVAPEGGAEIIQMPMKGGG